MADLKVTDSDDREWTLRNEPGTGQLPNLVICSKERRVILPDFAVLSPSAAVRLRSLDEAAIDVNLPMSALDTWRDILAERALEDDEVDLFYSDVRDTPVHLMRTIYSEMLTGKSDISSLVELDSGLVDIFRKGNTMSTMTETQGRRTRRELHG